ncbi:hypothetical protein AHF37_03145 [Paragonimus kellicotti]|nr:hypothetical protein AHF37_03145 [Paragonimus kellicotti]
MTDLRGILNSFKEILLSPELTGDLDLMSESIKSRRQRSRLSRRPIPEGQSTDASSEEGDHPGSDKTDGTSTALAMSRMKEKEELQHLNDRLARYIEFIQGNLLSPELTGDLDLMSESIKNKLNDLGRVYTDELDALRKNLDKVALQLTKNQVQLKTASSARDEALKELDEANMRESRLSKQLASLAAQLARVEKELSQSQERDTFATETLHVHLKAVSQEAEKYRVKLKSKLDELRKEMSNQLKDLTSKMEKNMETKLKAEKDRTRGAEAAAEAAREAHEQVQALLTTRSEELTRCRSELETTRQGVNKLNASLRDLDTKHRDALERSQRELNRVLDLLETKSNECADLAGIKVQLDAELAMYRSLLDSEESRCRLSPSERRLIGKSLVKKNVKKRPLSTVESDVDLDASSTKTEVGSAEGVEQRRQLFQRPLSDSAIRITCSSNGSIHFTSADPSDGLVRIFNASDEIHLCSSSGGQADQISPSQKRRRLPSPVLYVITDAQIWQPYDSAIKETDSEDVVRAICEIKPLASSSLGVGGLRRSNHGNSVALAISQWESIDKSKGADSSLQLTNIDFGSVHFRHEVRSDPQGYSDAATMPKLPCLNQKPLTAFFSSPKSFDKVSNKENMVNIERSAVALTKPIERSPLQASSDVDSPAMIDQPAKRPRVTEPEKSDSNTTNESLFSSKMSNFLGHPSATLSRESVNRLVAELKRKLSSRPTRSVLDLIQGLHPEWICALDSQLQSERFQKLADFVAAERAHGSPVYPPVDQVFTWSQLCPPSSVRVVILGQDPYHGPRQAHGLAFSVQRPLPPPPSLVNMYKEIGSSLPNTNTDLRWPPNHGDLTGWAQQGVLLLNAVLTVRAATPNSHKDRGWELLTDAVVRHLNKAKSHLVFMLWGSHAQKQGAGIDRKRHLVLQAPHPSPLSASRGFFGCGHFTKANAYLKEHGLPPVDWTQLE